MRKYACAALCCLMVAALFTGCRRRPVEETVGPTVTTHVTETTRHTEPTTRPTRPATRPTQPSTHATDPSMTTAGTEAPSMLPGVTDATGSTDTTGRNRGMSPMG